MLPRDKERIDRKALLEGLRRGTAGALALILSAQLLFGNGSASAIAEELTSVADSVVSSQVSGSDDAAAQADEGEAADSAGGDADEQQPAETASGDAAQDASGDEGSGEAASTGAEETSGQKADEQASADQKVADQDAAAEKSAEQKSDEQNAADQKSDAEQAEDETPAAARSWDDATDNLVLSTDGLALDEDAMGELAKQVSEYVAAVVSGERDEDAATYGVPATDAAGVELPESLPSSSASRRRSTRRPPAAATATRSTTSSSRATPSRSRFPRA